MTLTTSEDTPFSALLAALRRDGDGWTVTVPDDWLQGRTAYGGLTAALCHECAARAHPDLAPLRSAQFGFIGPSAGPLRLTSQELRRGKSTVWIGVDLVGEAGHAGRALLAFGKGRASVTALAHPKAPDAPPPDTLPEFFIRHPNHGFTRHFEGRLVSGAVPVAGAETADNLYWLRLMDEDRPATVSTLLALGDTPPPAVMSLFKEFSFISTMTWSVDFLSETVASPDGWWLCRSRAEHAADGYSTQHMTLWSSTGEAVLSSRQNVALFG